MKQPVIFKASPSLRKTFPLVLGIFFFGGLGVAMFLHSPYRGIALLNILMGLAALVALIFVLRRPLFILDQQGIRISKLWRMEVFVPWSEITGVDCNAADQYILVYVAHPERYADIDRLSKKWGLQPQGTLALTVNFLSEANRKQVCVLIRQRTRGAR